MSDINYLRDMAIARDCPIGISFTINNDGTHSFNVTAGDHSIPISSNDAEKMTFAEIIAKAFKDNE